MYYSGSRLGGRIYACSEIQIEHYLVYNCNPTPSPQLMGVERPMGCHACHSTLLAKVTLLSEQYYAETCL